MDHTEITYTIFMVHDSHGNRDYDVAIDNGEGIQICGMRDSNGEALYFESDAYHLGGWCEQHGLGYMTRSLTMPWPAIREAMQKPIPTPPLTQVNRAFQKAKAKKAKVWEYNDGGRADAGFKGDAGDCACRAVAIAMDRGYKEVYKEMAEFCKTEKPSKRRAGKSHPRTGVHSHTLGKYLDSLGWYWVPTMQVGSGCTVHALASELPMGRLIVRMSKHYSAVVNGVFMDTYDATREGTRCVYGYWFNPEGIHSTKMHWTNAPMGRTKFFKDLPNMDKHGALMDHTKLLKQLGDREENTLDDIRNQAEQMAARAMDAFAAFEEEIARFRELAKQWDKTHK